MFMNTNPSGSGLKYVNPSPDSRLITMSKQNSGIGIEPFFPTGLPY